MTSPSASWRDIWSSAWQPMALSGASQAKEPWECFGEDMLLVCLDSEMTAIVLPGQETRTGYLEKSTQLLTGDPLYMVIC